MGLWTQLRRVISRAASRLAAALAVMPLSLCVRSHCATELADGKLSLSSYGDGDASDPEK